MEGGMDEKAAKMEKLSSAAAFVEGGVQDACDDACSICLEAFCDSDPSTVAHPSLSLSRGHHGDWRAKSWLSDALIVSCFGLSQVTSCKHDFHLQCILEW
jgi:E3 ubiquitin-protein ligase RHF